MEINKLAHTLPQIYKVKCSFFLILVGIIGFISALSAQTAKDEIFANIQKSASNYYAYPEPDASVKQTPAPKDYKPFYISHYGRHGSRYLIDSRQYEDPMKTLSRADDAGMLTPLGKEVKKRVSVLCEMAEDRYGELTPLGARQHRGIAERMYSNFPEVFNNSTIIDARSTVVIRCILSMTNECMRFKELNPNLHIYTDASQHDMYYMNYDDKRIKSYRKDSAARATYAAFKKKHLHPERLINLLFTNTEYVQKHVNSAKLMTQLFDLAGNIQSMDSNITLYDLFTKDECYDLWLCDNAEYYINYGPSPLTYGLMPYSQTNLLTNILNTADTVLSAGKSAATLRFGHEICVMPLACLLELGNCGAIVNNLDELADKWKNYTIYPMACNIQFVFFRKKNSDDILVKALLNEREVSLPVKSDMAPYYHWADVKAYYRTKLAAFKNQPY
jgi:hypothetical protein